MMSTRQLGEATVKTLRRLAGDGATLDAMSRETGLRISEIEDAIVKHGIVRSASPARNGAQPAFTHRKIEWQVVAPHSQGGVFVTYAPSIRTLTLSMAALEALGRPAHIVVLWSGGDNLVGIRAATAGESGARKLAESRQISVRSLPTLAGGEPAKGRYAGRMDDGVLVIDLNAVQR